jgi:N-hydroxyarylamine O-acetyltransferase
VERLERAHGRHAVIDLAAYFARIGYDGPRTATHDTLTALVRAHVGAIAFESLDPFLGRGVAIDPASLEAKLVRQARGGYCFEQNGLLFAVLTALGYSVTPLAGRVRWMLPDEAPPSPLSHMLLLVHLSEGDFLCDVGFGGQSPTAPLRLAPGAEQQTPHGTYRLVHSDDVFGLEMQLPEQWAPMYRFRLEKQAPRDYEVFNWYTATHPASRFVNNCIAARVVGESRIALFNREFTRREGDIVTHTTIIETAGELHRVLDEQFGLEIEREAIERNWARLPGI